MSESSNFYLIPQTRLLTNRFLWTRGLQSGRRDSPGGAPNSFQDVEVLKKIFFMSYSISYEKEITQNCLNVCDSMGEIVEIYSSSEEIRNQKCPRTDLL